MITAVTDDYKVHTLESTYKVSTLFCAAQIYSKWLTIQQLSYPIHSLECVYRSPWIYIFLDHNCHWVF